jgi:hypothetical protein
VSTPSPVFAFACSLDPLREMEVLTALPEDGRIARRYFDFAFLR